MISRIAASHQQSHLWIGQHLQIGPLMAAALAPVALCEPFDFGKVECKTGGLPEQIASKTEIALSCSEMAPQRALAVVHQRSCLPLNCHVLRGMAVKMHQC